MFCQVVLFVSCLFAFLSFGIQRIVCTPLVPITLEKVQTDFTKDSSHEKFVVIRGMLYDVGDYTKFRSHPPGGVLAQPPVTNYIGKDATGLFPLSQSSCTQLPKAVGCEGKSCHSSDTWPELEKLNSHRRVAYTWDTIQTSRRYVLIKDLVYDAGTYLSVNDKYLSDNLTEVLRTNIGRDASKDIITFGIKNYEIKCMNENLLVGQIDGQPIGCLTSQVTIGLMIIMFVTVMMVKFVGAMIYTTRMSWKVAMTQADKDKLATHVLILVPCYSENEHQIKRTLDSVVTSNYNDSQKLVVIVADGVIVGSGNSQPTGEVALSLIEQDESIPQGIASSYHSVSHDRVSLNRARVYSGTIKTDTQRKVPVILIYKIGNIDEESLPKSGNRGKRDSQLILMSLLSRTVLNERMSPLEYQMFQHIKKISGVYVDKFEHVLMIDADTVIDKEVIAVMVKCLDVTPNIMALCGETRVGNKFESWVTMIQVFEYYVAHFLGKSFESLCGYTVTCLPGCASMFRIRSVTRDGAIVPILANPDLVEAYSDCNTTSLAKKNLLLLGEDRYLTTLLLKHFPRRGTCFLPQAFAYTTVPAQLSVLLSQRRRWVNSTVFNLWELMFVNKLCGIFCFSMQFVVFLDLLGTILAPASVAILVYIGLDLGTHGITQSSILPLAFICLVVALQCMLVFFPLKNVLNLFWMLLFLLATPIWQVLIPLYSFWNMDTFSWGTTRAIENNVFQQDRQLQIAHTSDEMSGNDPNKIPLKRWHEWHKSPPIASVVT